MFVYRFVFGQACLELLHFRRQLPLAGQQHYSPNAAAHMYAHVPTTHNCRSKTPAKATHRFRGEYVHLLLVVLVDSRGEAVRNPHEPPAPPQNQKPRERLHL
jgi:hypothetical protein